MTKHVTPPDVIGEALAMRAAGYTVLAISQRLGLSVRTLQRHFASTGTRKGAIRAEVVQKAKDELMARITSDEAIREEAARLVADDLAHSLHLREVILAASEQMTAATLSDAVQVMRAAAAYSTAIKNTSDIIRRSLRLEARDGTADELPELVVCELTSADIERLRATQAAEDDELGTTPSVSSPVKVPDDQDGIIEEGAA